MSTFNSGANMLSSSSTSSGFTPMNTSLFSSQSNIPYNWDIPPSTPTPSTMPWETQPTPSTMPWETQPTLSSSSSMSWETQPTPSTMPWETQPTPSTMSWETQPTLSSMPWETQPTPLSSSMPWETQPTLSSMPWETQPTLSSMPWETQPTPLSSSMPWETQPTPLSSSMPWETPTSSSSTPQIRPNENITPSLGFISTQSSIPNLYQPSGGNMDFDTMMANMGINVNTPSRVVIPKPEESISSIGSFTTNVPTSFRSTRKSKLKEYNIPISNPIPETSNLPFYMAYTPAGVLPSNLPLNTVRYEEIAQRNTVRPEALSNAIKDLNQKGLTVNQHNLRIELLNRKKPVVTGSIDLTSAYVTGKRTKSLNELDEVTIQSIINGTNVNLHIPDLQELIRLQGFEPVVGKRKDLMDQLRKIYKDKGIATSTSM